MTLSYDDMSTNSFISTLTIPFDSLRNLDGVNISCSSNGQPVGTLTIQVASKLYELIKLNVPSRLGIFPRCAITTTQHNAS